MVADNTLYDVTTSVKETETDDWTVTETNAGTYPMGIVAGDFENTNKNFTNVVFEIVDGTLKINPITDKVTVTITENSDEVTYDGQPHTIKGYESMVADNDLYDVTTAVKETETDAWTVTETNAGTYPMGIVAGDFENTNKNFTNVEFVIVDGTLVINPYSKEVTVTITENADEVEYDGNAHTIEGYASIKADNDLYDVKTAVKETPTDAWKVTETNVGTYDMGILPADFENTDKNFAKVTFVVVDGQLKINPYSKEITVTITENADEVEYDGKAHTIEGYASIKADSDLYDVKTAVKETKTDAWTVTETNAGTYDMGILPADFENTDKNFAKVTFVVVDGQLKINPYSKEVKVTITENADEVTYDGKEHTINGYKSIESDNDLYDVKTAVKETETADWTVAKTDAGTYDMGIKAADFENTDKNFAKVTFVVVDGQLKINPISDKVTVTITENADSVKYDGKEHKIEGYKSIESDNKLYDVKTSVKETETADWTVTEIKAGTYDMGIKAADFENINKNFTNVEFKIVDGQLKINPNGTKITVTADDAEKLYDGTPLTEDGYTTDGKLPEGHTFEVVVEGTITNAGEETNKVASVIIRDADGKDVTDQFSDLKLVDGKLTVNKRKLTLTSASDEKVYDGTPLTNDKVTISGDGLAPNENIIFNVTGSQTLVGSSENTFTYEFSRTAEKVTFFTRLLNTLGLTAETSTTEKADPSAADNYEIATTYGTLTVTEPDDDSKVIKKTHDGKDYGVGDTVKFTITVTNIYDEDKDITIEEIEGVKFTSDSEFKAVKPGATVTATAEYVLTEEDIYSGTFKNTATAKFSGEDKDYKGEDEVPTEKADPHMTVVKEVTSTPADGKKYAKDEKIEYKITVKNDGNLTIEDITVSDDLTGEKWTVKSLAPGEEESFTTSYTVTEADAKAGKVVNVATADGHNQFDDDDTPTEDGTTDTPTKDDTPKTGDDDDMKLWATMMVASLGCIILLFLKKRKNGKHYSN